MLCSLSLGGAGLLTAIRAGATGSSGGGFLSGLSSVFAPEALGASVGTFGLAAAGSLAAGGLASLLGGPGRRRAKRSLRYQKIRQIQAVREGAGRSNDQVLRSAAEARGASDQSLIDRGLYNSTVKDAQDRAINADASRQIADNNSGIASAISGIEGDYTTAVPDAAFPASLASAIADRAFGREYDPGRPRPTNQSGLRAPNPTDAIAADEVRQGIADLVGQSDTLRQRGPEDAGIDYQPPRRSRRKYTLEDALGVI